MLPVVNMGMPQIAMMRNLHKHQMRKHLQDHSPLRSLNEIFRGYVCRRNFSNFQYLISILFGMPCGKLGGLLLRAKAALKRRQSVPTDLFFLTACLILCPVPRHFWPEPQPATELLWLQNLLPINLGWKIRTKSNLPMTKKAFLPASYLSNQGTLKIVERDTPRFGGSIRSCRKTMGYFCGPLIPSALSSSNIFFQCSNKYCNVMKLNTKVAGI